MCQWYNTKELVGRDEHVEFRFFVNAGWMTIDAANESSSHDWSFQTDFVQCVSKFSAVSGIIISFEEETSLENMGQEHGSISGLAGRSP